MLTGFLGVSRIMGDSRTIASILGAIDSML
nr:MAG TPA: hypothetical protein [Caudoviricetes sp.]